MKFGGGSGVETNEKKKKLQKLIVGFDPRAEVITPFVLRISQVNGSEYTGVGMTSIGGILG